MIANAALLEAPRAFQRLSTLDPMHSIIGPYLQPCASHPCAKYLLSACKSLSDAKRPLNILLPNSTVLIFVCRGCLVDVKMRDTLFISAVSSHGFFRILVLIKVNHLILCVFNIQNRCLNLRDPRVFQGLVDTI
jgi:hypothetical protein